MCVFFFFFKTKKKTNLFHESYWPSVRWYRKNIINLRKFWTYVSNASFSNTSCNFIWKTFMLTRFQWDSVDQTKLCICFLFSSFWICFLFSCVCVCVLWHLVWLCRFFWTFQLYFKSFCADLKTMHRCNGRLCRWCIIIRYESKTFW